MRRSAVLIELVLDVLFLALSLLVLLRLFSAAYETSVLSQQKTRASMEMQQVLEQCRLDPPETGETRWYDQSFTAAADGKNRIEIVVSDEPAGTGVLRTLTLTAFAGQTELARLSGGCYLPGEVTP